jgi:hypothetical protein
MTVSLNKPYAGRKNTVNLSLCLIRYHDMSGTKPTCINKLGARWK